MRPSHRTGDDGLAKMGSAPAKPGDSEGFLGLRHLRYSVFELIQARRQTPRVVSFLELSQALACLRSSRSRTRPNLLDHVPHQSILTELVIERALETASLMLGNDTRIRARDDLRGFSGGSKCRRWKFRHSDTFTQSAVFNCSQYQNRRNSLTQQTGRRDVQALQTAAPEARCRII